MLSKTGVLLNSAFSAFQEISLCSVLQDVDSNNYSSLRNYGEGISSYSNTVQVWHHFIKQQVVQESSRILPSDVTCRLSGHVLRKSLDRWVQRFCSVKPSVCRSTQMRADITAVLLHTRSHFDASYWSIVSKYSGCF